MIVLIDHDTLTKELRFQTFDDDGLSQARDRMLSEELAHSPEERAVHRIFILQGESLAALKKTHSLYFEWYKPKGTQ